MSETDVDLRSYRLVLASHSLLNGRGRVRASRRLVDWAHRNGWGVYQLPEPSHALGGADYTPEMHGAEDLSALAFVFSQLRVYVEGGYEIAGVVLDPAEFAGEAGKQWLRALRTSADSAGIALTDVWVLDPGDATDPEPSARGALLTEEALS